jgi:serine/threonine protein kinase
MVVETMSLGGSSSLSGDLPRSSRQGPGQGLVGALLGPYKVTGIVAEGGMGVVYAAEHTLIGRRVAIKVLGADVSHDEEAVSRFFVEARAVNQIRHPNIVSVTDFGTHEGRHYIVMEHLEGETLGERLDKARLLPPLQAAHVARQVASALGAAHDAGLVHRDLKPANIFLCQHADYPDFVKVLDFGIAKLVKSQLQIPVGYATKVGSLLGTPSYMSPEQCLGEPTLDHRSDVYSLGVVLYLMVTGQLPFEDDSLGRLILSHVNQTPRPAWSVNPSVSQALSGVIARALEKRPADRYATMRELRHALDEALRPETEWARQAVDPAFTQPMNPMDSSDALFLGRRPTPDRPFATGTVTYTVNARPPLRPVDADEALAEKLTGMVRDRLANDALPLPELPPYATTCMARLRLPGLSAGGLAAFLAGDPALGERLLRLARSGAYGPPALDRPIDTVEQALARLGPSGLQQALVEMAARQVLEGADPRVRDLLREPWPYALAVAILAERLAVATGQPEQAQAAFLGGLVHDIGRPVVAGFLLAVERERAEQAGPEWIKQTVRQRVIDATFRATSVAVASRWMLPSRAGLAIERANESSRESKRSLGAVLGLAVTLARREGFFLRQSDRDDIDALVALGKSTLGIDESVDAKVTQGLRERVRALAPIRGV